MNLKKSLIIVFFCLLNFVNIVFSSERIFNRVTGAMVNSFLKIGIETVSDFYQTNCTCPKGIDPNVFKTLIRIAVEDCSKNKEVGLVFNSYAEDRDVGGKIVSNFGKSVQARAIELLKEPVVIKEPLPIFSTKKFDAMLRIVTAANAERNNANILVPELMVLARLAYERQTPELKALLMRQNIKPFDFTSELYNLLGSFLYPIDKSLANDSSTTGKELAPFFAIIQHCINAGDFDYYSGVKTPKQFDDAESRVLQKMKDLYCDQKMAYMLDDELQKRIAIEAEKNAGFEKKLTEHGVLIPAAWKNLNGNCKGIFGIIDKESEQEYLKIMNEFVSGKVAIGLHSEIEASRKGIEADFVKESNKLALEMVNDEWKAGGKELAAMQSKFLRNLKEYERDDVANIVQNQADQKQNKIAQSLLNRYDIAAKDELKKYQKGLKTIAQEKVVRSADALNRQNENKQRSSILQVLVKFVEIQKAAKLPKKRAVTFKRNSIKPSDSSVLDRQVLLIEPANPVGRAPELPGTAHLTRQNNPYEASVIMGDDAMNQSLGGNGHTGVLQAPVPGYWYNGIWHPFQRYES